MILYMVLITNEAIDSIRDFANTHGKDGFGKNWLKWMGFCISNIRLPILVNGILASFFQSSRRLRQRDPLSPYLLLVLKDASK